MCTTARPDGRAAACVSLHYRLPQSFTRRHRGDRDSVGICLYLLLIDARGVRLAVRVRGKRSGMRLDGSRQPTDVPQMPSRIGLCTHADEVQALLQPTNARGEPDLDGVSYIRDVVLRQILVASPDNVLWAVTGSSMAFVWTALAAMPVNGVAPMLQIRQAREVRGCVLAWLGLGSM